MEEKEKLSQELDRLKKVPHHSALPAGYFDNMQNEVMTQIQMTRSLPAENRTDIPAGYFDGLPDAVLAKVQVAQGGGGRVVIMRNVRWMAAAAVLVIVAVVMLKFVLPAGNETNSEQAYAALSKEFNQSLTSEEVNHLLQNYNSEEDLWLLKQLEPVDHNSLPEIEGLDSEEPLLQDILTDEEIEYLNEIM